MSALRKYRVGFLTPTLHRAGGTETWHEMMFRHLDRERLSVEWLYVVGPDDADDVRCELLRDTGEALGDYPWVGHFPLADLTHNPKVDVVVAWGNVDLDRYIPSRGSSYRPSVVMVSHGDGSTPYFPSVHAAAAPHVDHWVAVSKAALEAIPAGRRGQAVVLSNGVDLERLEPKLTIAEQRQAWGVPKGKKVVGVLSRCSEEKDPYALARCVAALPDDWVGVLVGDGEEYQHVRADGFVRTLGRCYYPGMTLDVGSALQTFNVLLCPSRQEGFGLAAVEGVMAGVPVVSTPVGVALEHHNWFRLVEIDASGPRLAWAVQFAEAGWLDPKYQHKLEAAKLYGSEAFGKRWSTYLADVCRDRSHQPEDTHACVASSG